MNVIGQRRRIFLLLVLAKCLYCDIIFVVIKYAVL